MADRLVPVGGEAGFQILFKDLGSNTYAPGFVAVGSSSNAPGAVAISQATPGTTNAVQLVLARGTTIHHRTAITAVDKLATPGSPSVADVATGGSLNFNTAYNVTLAAGNRYGSTTVPANGTVTTANDASATHVARCTIAQVPNSEWYDLFLSTAANPLWVARVTEAQRAAGVTVTAVGTVSATSPGAGIVDIRVIGTGLGSNVAPFAANNAYTPALITPLALPAGYSVWEFTWSLAVTDLRSLPTLVFVVAVLNPTTLDFPIATSNAPVILSAIRGPLIQSFSTTVRANSQCVVLVDTLSGQGASVDVYATPISAPP